MFPAQFAGSISDAATFPVAARVPAELFAELGVRGVFAARDAGDAAFRAGLAARFPGADFAVRVFAFGFGFAARFGLAFTLTFAFAFEAAPPRPEAERAAERFAGDLRFAEDLLFARVLADFFADFAFFAFFGAVRFDLFFGLDFLAMCGLYLRLSGLQPACRPGVLPPVCGIMPGACSRLRNAGLQRAPAFPALPDRATGKD